MISSLSADHTCLLSASHAYLLSADHTCLLSADHANLLSADHACLLCYQCGVEYIVVCTETLKKASVIAPDLLLKTVDEVRLKHRNTTFCDELTSYVHSLDKPS